MVLSAVSGDDFIKMTYKFLILRFSIISFRCCYVHDKCYDAVVDSGIRGWFSEYTVYAIPYITRGCSGCGEYDMVKPSKISHMSAVWPVTKTSRTFLFLHFTFLIRASNVVKTWCLILQVVQVAPLVTLVTHDLLQPLLVTLLTHRYTASHGCYPTNLWIPGCYPINSWIYCKPLLLPY